MQNDEDVSLPEAGEVQIPEVPTVPETTLEPSGEKVIKKDPLDDITDPNTLRGEAKKFRSIAQRKDKPEETKVETPVPTGALTHNDLVRINTKTAKGLVDAPVSEHWNELVEYLPPKYRNAETPDEIAKGMKVAYSAWQQDNPEAPANPGADLTTTPAVKRTSAKPAVSGERTTQPILPKSTTMTDWYPKKS